MNAKDATCLLMICSCVMALPAQTRVLPSVAAQASATLPARPLALPSDAELEAAHAIIGTVTFEALDPFDTSSADEDVTLFRLANRLHFGTREGVIRNQLLFHEGEPYRARLLEESERMLRGSRYLRDASIRPIAWHDGIVDILVTTQDVWTFNPGASFGRKGGRNTSGFELEELNLLGTGTQLGVGFKSGIDRDSKWLAFRDRQIGSSRWDLATRLTHNSDGRGTEISLEHPFFALDTRNAGGLLWRDELRADARYARGRILDRYGTRARFASMWIGRSSGWRDGWSRRYSIGVTRDESTFTPLAALDDLPGTSSLPADRRLVYPWIAAEWIEDDFRIERNRDQIGKTEDYSLGWRLKAKLGIVTPAFGSDRNAIAFDARLENGLSFDGSRTLQYEAYAKGRREGNGLAGTLFGAGARYWRQSPQKLLYMTLSADVGRRLDADQQLLLGGDNGLRGYPLRYLAGEGRWLFTAEQRWFTTWYPFRLLNVGAAAFFDAGGTFERDDTGTSSTGTLKDLGFGLRLGGNRSAQGNVLHIDVAFPLDGDRSINRVQLVVETKHRF